MEDHSKYNLKNIADIWSPLSPLVAAPETESEYQNLVSFLDRLIDAVGNDENHPLASLMDLIGSLIVHYENQHHPFSEGDPVQALQYLMKINAPAKNELDEIGEPDLSEIMERTKDFTVDQIRALSKRFNVSPATFI